jgi:hypothetical protein
MVRIASDPNYTGPSFPRATEATDPFKKEDVQQLAAAVSTHVHDGVHGLQIDVARPNLLINGGLEVWQRGNGPFASGLLTADMWQVAAAAGGTASVTRDTTNTDGGSGVGACAAVSFGALADPTNRLIQSMHLTVEFGSLLGKTVTLSARVKCSTPNSARLGANLNAGANNYQYGAYHSGSGLYETLTFTVTIPAGTQYFQPGLFVSTIGNTVYLDNAMLVLGSQAANYVPLHPADDLARCLRYYEKFGGGSNSLLFFAAYGSAGAVIGQTISFAAKKAVTPTMTKNGSFSTTNCAQPVVDIAEVGAFRYYATVTATGASSFTTLDPTSFITAEANP